MLEDAPSSEPISKPPRKSARQLRLRNIGGLIVVDFIDMRGRGAQQKVTNRMRDGVKRDKGQDAHSPISQLGLLEMTRQRHSESMASASTRLPELQRQRHGQERALRCRSKFSARSATCCAAFAGRADRANRQHPQSTSIPKCSTACAPRTKALLIELEKKLQGRLSFRADPTFHSANSKSPSISGADWGEPSRLSTVARAGNPGASRRAGHTPARHDGRVRQFA